MRNRMKYLDNVYKKMLMVMAVVTIVSCNPSEFGDLNIDPNNTTVPQTDLLLTSSIRRLPYTSAGNNGRAYRYGNHYVQYVGNTQYTNDDNYDRIDVSFNDMYVGPLIDLKFIIEYCSDPETAVLASAAGSPGNQIAVSKILMAYWFLHITDRWGDVPFSEALSSGDDPQIFSPVYDTQESIYNGIFAMLKEALTDMDSGDGPTGDILLGGDMARWAQFANTIRMVAALRISKVNPTLGSSEFNSALNAGVISESVNYQYLAEATNENPWYSAFRTRADWSLTDTMVDYMNINTATNPFTGAVGKMDVAMDPRLPQYANATEESNFTEYVGQPYGLREADAGAISNGEVSMLGNHMRQQDLTYPIYSLAQVLFCRAEAAQLTWTSEDPQQLYYDAIQASLDQFEVGDEYATYITNSEVVYNPSKAYEQIARQKWLALFLQGYEAWSNWRRTDFPTLIPSPNGIQSSEIPTRQGYATSERDLNSVNWQAAIDRQFGGVDDLNGKVWWDK